jgi:hypothetical protein
MSVRRKDYFEVKGYLDIALYTALIESQLTEDQSDKVWEWVTGENNWSKEKK